MPAILLGSNSPCPCRAGSAKAVAYGTCCGRYHAGPQRLLAPDAEQLMRSRYSAYVLRDTAYLRATWLPDTCPADLDLDADPAGLQWLGLDVRQHTQQDGTHATVHFIARSKFGGRAQRMEELSRFVRADGHWLYVDGDLADTPPRTRR